MDPLLGPLIFLGVTGAFTAVVASAAAAKRYTRRRHGAPWAVASRRLGLVFEHGQLYGRRHGQSVFVRSFGGSGSTGPMPTTFISSKLALPLDLGLCVAQDRNRGGVAGAPDATVGDAAFDARYVVNGDEPARVRAALTPRLRRLLLANTGDVAFILSDLGMVIHATGRPTNARWLMRAIDLCAQAANLLDHARARVPAAAPLAKHHIAWERYASSAGLSGMSCPLCMWGTIDGARVHVHAVRMRPMSYQLDVRVLFAPQLGIGLLLRPVNAVDPLSSFFGTEDVSFDDPAFDRTFVVKGSEDEVRERLDTTARRELLTLQHDIGPVTLTDEGLSVRLPYVPHDPSSVPTVVQRMAGLAQRLAVHEARGSLGPYR